jgi:hypothetical protein
MSEQQVERLQAMLAKVQQNRQQARGGVTVQADSGITMSAGAESRMRGAGMEASNRANRPNLTGDPSEAVTAAVPAPDQRKPAVEPRVRANSPEKIVATAATEREEPASAPPPLPAARQPAAAQSRSQPEPVITPRVIEPDPPRTSGRPIAQLVSKHAPAVDATFGAMLKRSLSLRPH